MNQETLNLELYQKIIKPCPQSDGRNEVVNCPVCFKLIKGRGSMMSHFRHKHLPKYFDQAYCIKHRARMCHFQGNRNTWFCGYCAVVRKKFS